MESYIIDILSRLLNLESGSWLAVLLANVAQVLVVVLTGLVVKISVQKWVIGRVRRKKGDRRADTLSQLIETTLSFTVWFLVLLISLDVVGVNITPILASAGVLGLAIGFGSQSLVKDVVAGFFHFLDNNYNLGEVIEVDGFTGKVTQMNLRMVHLTNFLGAEKIINQGSIGSLINWSRNQTAAVVDFGVAYETDLKHLNDVIIAFVETLQNQVEELVETPTFLGVMELGDSSINCRILGKTEAGNHWAAARKIRKELVANLKENDIEIPFPQVVVSQK
jgi:moderate conductance mechanosensitive channel